MSYSVSRRDFIKQCVIAGIAVYSAPLLANLSLSGMEDEVFDPALLGQWKQGGKVKFRSDGLAKVTGQKIYSRDYRAQDLAGWPSQQQHALLIRLDKADRVYLGLDLSMLPANALPRRVITATDLVRDGVELPSFYGINMMVSEGATPDYLGHAAAMLIFADFATFNRAKQILQFNNKVVRYGDVTPLVATTRDPWACWRIIRIEGKLGMGDQYSTLKNGLFFPAIVSHQPVWPTARADGNAGEQGMYQAGLVHKELEAEDALVLDRSYQTQFIEPMMMEPENFNGWFDAKARTMHLVVSTQSPHDFYYEAAEMLAKGPLAGKVDKLVVHSPFIGGGFGAKDHTIFPFYGLLATLYGEGPVRLANDRFEQFQGGLKRHPFNMHNKLVIDKQSGQFRALISAMTVDGGGRLNFTGSVASVGASAIQGVYYLPRNDITAVALPSENPDCGSMRGYGSLQTMAAMEMMVNEAAALLNMDPLELRRRNLIKPGQPNTQGAIPEGNNRYPEILAMAEQHEIWAQRQARKQAYEAQHPDRLHGTGFGITTKDYGTGAVAPSACVELTSKGEILLKISGMEMGTGIQTSQAEIVSRYLGQPADTIALAEIALWDSFKLVSTDNPYTISQERQDEMQKNPRWTLAIPQASSASISSYFQSHATVTAARILFEQTLWPAATAIWRKQYFVGQAGLDLGPASEASWTPAGLTTRGMPPLPLALLAAHAHANGLITGAMVHSFNRWAWAECDFTIEGQSQRLPIDALALRYGDGASSEKRAQADANGYQLLDRTQAHYPSTSLNNAMVTYYAPCATLVEIAVEKGSGKVHILSAHSWLDAGRVIVPELVEGQIQGGLAMGVGHALYEYLPAGQDGPGNGTWNLNRYQVPLAHQLPVWNLTHTLLDPLSPTDATKGIGEVVMIPVVAALVEAIYQATGTRFYHLPVTATDIQKAIQ
ncbi:xanthine dehydrogenase family protein molybdopterin-binding subunit [Aeromonas rivipollensis]|uniref:xanthine dehydrogenase family protein molybdopterin-binding subunit n=1 Tax=Aeromonas rivipollensis TaxID=948519 RepID=UPI003D198AE9